MRIEELDSNVSTIHKFLLNFKRTICSEISIINGIEPIILWKFIFNNKNTFNPSKCFAKTDAGNQCKRTKGYCNSVFCGLHYSGKGAHVRKRNETTSRFYEKDNRTILNYRLEFSCCKFQSFNLNNLLSIYIKGEKHYIDSSNGDIYSTMISDNCGDRRRLYNKINNINSNNLY